MRKLTKHVVRAVLLALVSVAMPATAGAQTSGALDSAFGSSGFTTVAFGSNAAAAATAVQPNGDIVTAGETWVNGGATQMILTRMTPAGQLDPTFGTSGVVTVPINGGGGVDSGAALTIQSDGKIVVVGGGRNGTYGPIEFAAVRLNIDGSLDQSFGNGGVAIVPIGPYSIANAVAIQTNGDIVMGGTAQQGANTYFAAARLTPSGSLDQSFGSGGITFLTSQPPGAAWGMVLQQNGGIVLVGYQAQCSNCANAYMAMRLLANGQLDRRFAHGGVFTRTLGSYSAGLAAGLESNGDIVISGDALTSGGYKVATVALTPNGSLDQGFGSGGIAEFSGWGINALVVDSAGRIDLAGSGASVVRLTPNGGLDPGFGSGGLAGFYCDASNCSANGIAVQPADGGIVLAGATELGGTYKMLVLRISP